MQNIAEEQAGLHIVCRKCGRAVILPGRLLVERHGPDAVVATVLRRYRCRDDGMMPDAVIVLNSDEQNSVARGLSGVGIYPPGISFRPPVHSAWPKFRTPPDE